ncbi:MAG: response regulator transcription factor [Paucibacter sp.]|nr:response regulator transcription factor [Roseateles sp.]
MRILVVEDNADIAANLHAFMEPKGYAIDWERNGEAGLVSAARGVHDVIVLDLMLPGLSGLEVCRRLRHELRLATPVLLLTALDTVPDKVQGFEAGADDYVVKPFSLTELDVRLKALQRRALAAHVPAPLQVADLLLDPGTHEARRAGRLLELTPSGHKLLQVLMQASPRLVPRQTLEFALWGDDPPDSDALRTHIHALRQAIDKPFGQPLLRNRPGLGYAIAPPEDAAPS